MSPWIYSIVEITESVLAIKASNPNGKIKKHKVQIVIVDIISSKRFLNSDLIRKKMANINVIKLIYALISINQNILKLVVNPKMIINFLDL